MTGRTTIRRRAAVLCGAFAMLLIATINSVVADPEPEPTLQDRTITGAKCDPAYQSNCVNCNVDIGTQNGNTYCWATRCDDEGEMTFRTCRTWPSEPSSTCFSESTGTFQCTNCKSWRCTLLNEPNMDHSTHWCNLGSCICTYSNNYDWSGTWSSWLICTP